VVAVDHDGVAVDGRGGALAERAALVHEHRQVVLPFEIAVEVVGVEAARAKVGEEGFAVGKRRVRSKAAVDAPETLMRCRDGGSLLPDGFAGFEVERHHDELVFGDVRAAESAVADVGARRG